MMIRSGEDWRLLMDSLMAWREEYWPQTNTRKKGTGRNAIAKKLGIDWRRIREIEEFTSPTMVFALVRLSEYCEALDIELEVIPHGKAPKERDEKK